MIDTLDLKTIFRLVIKRLWIILSGGLVGGVALFLVSTYLMTPVYTSSTILYVNANPSTTISAGANLNDLNLSQRLVDTYIVILKNKTVLELVSNELSVSMSPSAIASTLSMNSVNQTEVMEIRATTDNPELSAEICNVLAKVAPSELKRIVKAGSVEVVSPAVPSYSSSSPNVTKNTLIGVILGLMLAFIAVLIIHVFDNTVKTADELHRILNIPVLGEVADFETTSKGGKY